MFDQDPTAAGLLLEKLAGYREFAEFYGSGFSSYAKAHWNQDLFGSGSTRIRIAGLNTVLVSDQQDALGQMLLTQNQYMLPRETNVEYLVLMHHPIEWLKNSRFVREYFENRARIWLMGHDHKQPVDCAARRAPESWTSMARPSWLKARASVMEEVSSRK